MKKLKIYLAGRMSGLTFEEMINWRTKISLQLKIAADYVGNVEINTINPVCYYNFKNIRHQSEKEIQDFDLNHVKSSDIVIVNLEGLSKSVGTIIELFEANYNHKIPVIAFGDKDTYLKLHPWIKESITRVEKNIDDVVTYIRDFYMA